MDSKRLYVDDLMIRDALLKKDGKVTGQFLYRQCYPLFKSIYDNYYTDCSDVKEFIDEIYLLLVTPGKLSGTCQLEHFRGESSLASWLKTVCIYYCYNKYAQKEKLPKFESILHKHKEEAESNDRSESQYGSIEMDLDNMNRDDVNIILNLMPNKRYSNIIRMLYLENRTYEDAADTLDMNMSNFYNKNKLAKEQFIRILRKEERND